MCKESKMRSGTWILIGTLLVGCGQDQDEDGYRDKEDCNDSDAEIFPGAAEQCDGVDNDCDGDVDEGLLLTWFADEDEDTYGALDSSIDACTQPSGYVENSEDCNDESSAFYPGAPEDDCSDDNDYNCDGSVGYDDADGDGFAACEGDCDDADVLINEEADEVCDGVDNNCDGFADLQAVDATTWHLDHDGDGFGDVSFELSLCDQPPNYVDNSDDCDDLDPTSYPNADEVCDLTDNDCDGTTDEDDALDTETWHLDSDGDGYGDLDSTTAACPDATGLGPTGYVADSTDCDDSEELVNPGAVEFCDDIDNDCDDIIDTDASDTVIWYVDVDGDGYGVGTSTQESCEQPSGYALNANDCNDSSSAISPAATEICDGIDNDCDGDVDDDDANVDATTGDTWYADSDSDGYGDGSAPIDACYQPTGYVDDSEDCDDTSSDVNPDAIEVCDDGIDNNCDSGADSCQLELSSAGDVAPFYGETSGEGTFSLSHADINDDGTEDIILGAYNASNGGSSALDGAAYVFFGPFSGDDSLSGADLTITGTSGEKDAFGIATAGLGDFDDDGTEDFAIAGSQVDNTLVSASTTAGGIFIFSGASVSAESALDATDADIILMGEGKQHYLGASVVGGRDLNSDGIMDLLVGASRAPDRSTAEGAVYVVYGGVSAASYTISDVAQARVEGEDANDKIGTAGSVAMVGDMNGDGEGDMVVGAYLHNSETGAAYLLAGPISGESMIVDTAAAKMVPASTGDYAGRGVSSAGDVNNDGYDDFWLSSPREDTTASSAGAVFLMYGAATISDYDGASIDTEAAFAIYGSSGSDQIGAVIDGSGDLDGDGSNDLLIGMPS
ncbi:MAG: hypothetical protein ACI8S6_001874, partial [Myxococcota bacterium]